MHDGVLSLTCILSNAEGNESVRRGSRTQHLRMPFTRNLSFRTSNRRPVHGINVNRDIDHDVIGHVLVKVSRSSSARVTPSP
jgi:hypothetical protein